MDDNKSAHNKYIDRNRHSLARAFRVRSARVPGTLLKLAGDIMSHGNHPFTELTGGSTT